MSLGSKLATPRVISSHRIAIGKLKKSSSLKLKGPELLCFVCSCVAMFSNASIYYVKFDKHHCIDFHWVQCNERTSLALGIF